MVNRSKNAEEAPRVSVITAVRNAENFIAEAVGSILCQTLQDLEFIIVDDGSTDGTVATISRFLDSRIRLISLAQSVGPSNALNFAISKTKSRFIAVLDGDDVAHAERLAYQVDFLEKNPTFGAVGSWARVFGAHDSVRRPPSSSNSLKASLLWGNPLVHSSITIRRSALPRESEVYRASEPVAYDYGLLLRIAKTWDLANLPFELVRYRSHASQLSALNIAVMESSFFAARNEFLHGMGLSELNSLRPSICEIARISRALTSRGWLEGPVLYWTWLKSWFTAPKNAILRLAKRNSVVRSLVGFGRKLRSLRQSPP